MKYLCETCNYSTDTKFCYQKHLKTNKHNENVHHQLNYSPKPPQNSPKLSKNEKLKDIICQFCNQKFTRACNLTRHKKICSENPTVNNTLALQDKDKEIEHLKDKIEMLQSENRNLKIIVTNAGSIIKTSVSTLSYVMQNYTDAPALKPLNDYDTIQYNDKDDEFDIMTMIFHHHRKRSLAGYLGDFIVKSYKKDDPSQQALWSSDAVRLTYVVREILNKKTDWSVDKGGIKTSSYIINPFLEYIKQLLVDFNEENRLENHLNDNVLRMKQRMDDLNASAEIIANIKNKVLSEQLLKHIAPHFYLNKNDQLIDG